MIQRQLALLGAISLLILSAGASLAQDGTPTWLRELTQQLEKDEGCDVAFYIRVKDHFDEGSALVEARAKCRDGREFDAFREERTGDFIINACAIAVCEVKSFDLLRDPA